MRHVLGAGEVKPAAFDDQLPGDRLAGGCGRCRCAGAAARPGRRDRGCGGLRAGPSRVGLASGRRGAGLRRRRLRCRLAHGGRPRTGHLWLRRRRRLASSAGGSLSGRSVIARKPSAPGACERERRPTGSRDLRYPARDTRAPDPPSHGISRSGSESVEEDNGVDRKAIVGGVGVVALAALVIGVGDERAHVPRHRPRHRSRRPAPSRRRPPRPARPRRRSRPSPPRRRRCPPPRRCRRRSSSRRR